MLKRIKAWFERRKMLKERDKQQREALAARIAVAVTETIHNDGMPSRVAHEFIRRFARVLPELCVAPDADDVKAEINSRLEVKPKKVFKLIATPARRKFKLIPGA